MTVYHGSNVEVHEPKILKPNRELDFGRHRLGRLSHKEWNNAK